MCNEGRFDTLTPATRQQMEDVCNRLSIDPLNSLELFDPNVVNWVIENVNWRPEKMEYYKLNTKQSETLEELLETAYIMTDIPDDHTGYAKESLDHLNSCISAFQKEWQKSLPPVFTDEEE